MCCNCQREQLQVQAYTQGLWCTEISREQNADTHPCQVSLWWSRVTHCPLKSLHFTRLSWERWRWKGQELPPYLTNEIQVESKFRKGKDGLERCLSPSSGAAFLQRQLLEEVTFRASCYCWCFFLAQIPGLCLVSYVMTLMVRKKNQPQNVMEHKV